MSVIAISCDEDFTTITNKTERSLLFFWAEWHEPSKTGGQMQSIYQTLSTKYERIKFYTVEAEKYPRISESLDVTVVPTFVCIEGTKVIGKLDGAIPPQLAKFVKEMEVLDISTKVLLITIDICMFQIILNLYIYRLYWSQSLQSMNVLSHL